MFSYEQVKEDTIPIQKTGISQISALLDMFILMGGFILAGTNK